MSAERSARSIQAVPVMADGREACVGAFAPDVAVRHHRDGVTLALIFAHSTVPALRRRSGGLPFRAKLSGTLAVCGSSPCYFPSATSTTYH
jgi:hypothetical protein